MTTTQISLDAAHAELLRSLAEQTGKPADEVVQEGLDLLASRLQSSSSGPQLDWRACLKSAAGMWKDRDDLPDWEELRRSMDRVDRLWGPSGSPPQRCAKA